MPINNTIGKISVKTADLPRSKFDFSASLHTTMQFGEVVAGYFDMMYPGDKRTVRSSERLLAAPLLAPVFGKAKLKGVHQFVPFKALTRNFEPLLSQESVNRGTTSFVVSNLPNMSLRDLSLFMLWGAKCTVYEGDASLGNDPDANSLKLYKYSGSSGNLTPTDPASPIFSLCGFVNDFSYYGLSNAYRVGASRLLDDYAGRASYRDIPLSNHSPASFFDVDPSCDYYKEYSGQFDLDTVPVDKADVVVPLFFTNSGTDYQLFYAFRLSSFGKRLKKILNVLGYQFNVNSSVQIDLLPFMAFYRAYFDLYAPKLYKNWEETYSYRITQISDLSAGPTVTNFWKNSYGSLTDIQQAVSDFFVTEFGATFYTEEQNFWSAHTRNTAVSPSAVNFVQSIDTDVTVTTHPNIYIPAQGVTEPTDLNSPSNHALINDPIHGQLDANLLERLYRWTNKNTLAGRRIGELLRMQGLGRYHDDEPDYIGQFEVPLNIYDMLSQSDTYSKAADSGAPLGERAGNGQAQSQEKPFTYEATEYGFWVTLMCVVPEGTFTETIAPHALALKKFDFHMPDFDSLGYEFSKKLLLQGSMPFADFVSADGTLDDSYGIAPRYFRWKFGRSVQTGDFTLRSVRDSVAPYSLEKYVNVGERAAVFKSEDSSKSEWKLLKLFKPKDLPIAGDVWRYVTRYPFIGHFNRIFNYSTGTHEVWYRSIGTNQAEFEFFSWMADNFILHVYFDVDNRSKKLPVSRSFETDEDGNVNAAIGKA